MSQISANKRTYPVLITLLLSVCVSDCTNVTAKMGTGVILPCHCSESSALISWQKGTTIVYSHNRSSTATPEELRYRRRTGILENNCSLVLSQVHASDEGEYTCYYQTESFFTESVTLHVTAIATCQYKSGLYHCMATWGSPEGKIVWRLNGQTQFLHPVFFQKKLDQQTGLYDIASSASITSNGTVTCEVETFRLVTEIVQCVSGNDPHVQTAPETSWNVLLVSVVCGALVVLLITVCSWIKKHRKRTQVRKLVPSVA